MSSNQDALTVGDMAGWELVRYPSQDAARAAQRLRLGDATVNRVLAFAREVAHSPEPSCEVDMALYSDIEDALGCWPCPAVNDDGTAEYWYLGSTRSMRPGSAREHLLLKGKPIFCTALLL